MPHQIAIVRGAATSLVRPTLFLSAVARGPTSRMFILSAVLEIRPVGCTFQALGYISERSRAKRREHGEQFSFVCFKLRIFRPYFSLYMSQHMILIKSSKSGIIM